MSRRNDVRPASRIPWKAALSALLAVAYGASPLDVIPDVIPLLGWLDDAVAVPVLLALALVQYRRYRRAEPMPPTLRTGSPRTGRP